MVLIKRIDKKFKKRNLAEWKKNSNFWLNSLPGHIEEISNDIFKYIIEYSSPGKTKLLDVGCGNGWVADIIDDLSFNINYTGLDFNHDFILHLKNKFRYKDNFSFVLNDIEDIEINEKLNTKFNLIVNCFNFFEIPNLDLAFKNTAKLLDTNGILIVVTIEPILQQLSISNDDMRQFRKNLFLYEDYMSNGTYSKKIDMGFSVSDKEYFGILYSIKDYINEGIKNNLSILRMEEIVKTSAVVPKVYQILFLKKQND